jgi:very-short-patch-repair endonuclease
MGVELIPSSRNSVMSKDTLIALLKYENDLEIALKQKWYRIPVKTAPKMVRDERLKYLALYQPKAFKENAFQIRWVGEVRDISIVKRKELLPEETGHPRSEEDYYRIELTELHPLSHPIISQRKRRMLFITTTFGRFQQAHEINDLFFESPIEERMWDALKKESIDAERQYWMETPEGNFFLDFAIFSKERNIDVECNGDTHHTGAQDVKRDKRRNNILESKGWAVFRYTAEEIMHHITKCICQLKETVNRYGGLQDANDSSRYRLLGDGRFF